MYSTSSRKQLVKGGRRMPRNEFPMDTRYRTLIIWNCFIVILLAHPLRRWFHKISITSDVPVNLGAATIVGMQDRNYGEITELIHSCMRSLWRRKLSFPLLQCLFMAFLWKIGKCKTALNPASSAPVKIAKWHCFSNHDITRKSHNVQAQIPPSPDTKT